MAMEIFIKGKRCRVYHEGYMWIWIADTGDFATHYDAGGRYHGKCRILKQHLGPFIVDKYGNRILIARAVMESFGPTVPTDEKTYTIGFKDGNQYNCDYRNLEWVEYHYKHTAIPKVRIYCAGEFVEVYSTGTIKVGGQEEHPVDYHYDPDMELFSAWSELEVKINKQNAKIDELMTAAGYVQGDDAGLKQPVILHRDMDYKNFASDNLEWVEETDQRYIDYCKKREDDRRARTMELNKGKHVPDDWI